jgi:hypothetical protein
MAGSLRLARFRIDTGPAELFERIWFKLRDTRHLAVHGDDVRAGRLAHAAPVLDLQHFDAAHWQLVGATVMAETADIVESLWTVEMLEQTWWVVIGKHATLRAVSSKRPHAYDHAAIVRDGPGHDFVAQVCREQMSQELFALLD